MPLRGHPTKAFNRSWVRTGWLMFLIFRHFHNVDDPAKYSGNGIFEGQKLALLGCDWPRDQGRRVSLCLKCVSEIHIKYLPRWYKPLFISLINWVPACFFEQRPNQLCVS